MSADRKQISSRSGGGALVRFHRIKRMCCTRILYKIFVMLLWRCLKACEGELNGRDGTIVNGNLTYPG